jgi:hypothetical protein
MVCVNLSEALKIANPLKRRMNKLAEEEEPELEKVQEQPLVASK